MTRIDGEARPVGRERPTQINITAERRRAVRAIKRLVEPHFGDSGYVTRIDPKRPRFAENNRRPIRMYAPEVPVMLRGAFKLEGFWAITEFGPMTDAHGSGMVLEAYSESPLEDLLKLRAWAEKTFAVPPAPAPTAPTHGATDV